MSHYKILDWDTDFFGFTVAQILPSRLKKEELGEILKEMGKNNIKLAYWASDPDDEESQACARSSNALLVDRKTTYFIESRDIQARLNFPDNPEIFIEEYPEMTTSPELEELAVQAGVHSRFKVDAQIPENKFVELYKIWMRRSITREVAKKVFVVRSEGKIAGMVTVGEKGGRADIGLLAVDASLRGKNAGTALVRAAQNWGVREGYYSSQVVTQGDNIPACRFYEKCGYRVDKVENIHHFWIGK